MAATLWKLAAMLAPLLLALGGLAGEATPPNDGTCPAGGCDAADEDDAELVSAVYGEEEVSAMQKGGIRSFLRRELIEEAKEFKPNNTEDCYKVPDINTGVPIVYDASCTSGGECCFEPYPCRYCPKECEGNGECKAGVTTYAAGEETGEASTTAVGEETGSPSMMAVGEKTSPSMPAKGEESRVSSKKAAGKESSPMPNNTADCYQVPGINKDLPIVYDKGCPGKCCFESYPCRYCTEDCRGNGACTEPKPTTAAVGEEGSQPTTYAMGEEGPQATTYAVGEEGPQVTTYAVGEEGPQVTTYAVGEEGPEVTTYAMGEEGSQVTTYAVGEEGTQATTYAVGEEGPQVTTFALGEEASSFVTSDVASKGNPTKPNSTADCYKVPGINTGLPILYDASCSSGGKCCFESYPCRYCTSECEGNGVCVAGATTYAVGEETGVPSTKAAGEESSFVVSRVVVKGDPKKPNNTADCYNVPGINKGLPIVYDKGCPGKCCFESYPCRYCTDDCRSNGACTEPEPTTAAVGEEGTTYAMGEEGSQPTTYAVGEEGPQVTTYVVGEEGPQVTTHAVGEEGPQVTTYAVGEEGPQVTTYAVGEEGPQVTTYAMGEEASGFVALHVAAKGDPAKPNNTADCYKVPGINTDLPILYDTSCVSGGKCCFQSYPCRYCTADCEGNGVCVAGVTTYATGEETGVPSTKAAGEESSSLLASQAAEKATSTTYMFGEEGPASQPSTYATGEEGPEMTTYAVGEEGSQPTTYAMGEEGQPTTYAMGEEGQPTTYAMGEEGPEMTTMAMGEEGSQPTTYAMGEEGPQVTTYAMGEEGSQPTTLATGEEGSTATTLAAGGEEEPSTRAAGEESAAALQVPDVGCGDSAGAKDVTPAQQRKVGEGAPHGSCLVVVAGGLQDFNLKALLPRLQGEQGFCKVLPMLLDSYTPRNPQVDWNMQDDRLVVNGEVVKPTGMFIRYDVFGTHVDPVKRQAFFELWDGYARSHPDQVRFLNIGYGGRTNKLVTLSMAKSLGLEIPKTLATNSPPNALAFLGEAGKITKPLAGGKETERLREAVTPNDHEMAAAFIQEELLQPEMRVFGVDGVFLCLGLTSPSIDYRLHQDAKLSLMPTCPKDLIPALHTIMKNMGLRYGAADFKTRASDRKWIFLEMNSEPMFAAFDRASKGLLRDMIGSWLEGQYSPYKGCQNPSSPVVCANSTAA